MNLEATFDLVSTQTPCSCIEAPPATTAARHIHPSWTLASTLGAPRINSSAITTRCMYLLWGQTSEGAPPTTSAGALERAALIGDEGLVLNRECSGNENSGSDMRLVAAAHPPTTLARLVQQDSSGGLCEGESELPYAKLHLAVPLDPCIVSI